MLQGVGAPSKVYRKHEGPVHCLAQGLLSLGILLVTIDEKRSAVAPDEGVRGRIR